MKKEGVNITVEDGTLTISGERKFDQKIKKDHPLALALDSQDEVESACHLHGAAGPADRRTREM